MRSHPDRRATTLATVPAEAAADGMHTPPGAGARDCRIDLKLLQWRAQRAMSASAQARARLAQFNPQQRPDLWAGTVQDGAARGFAAALEEAVSLGPPEPPLPQPPEDPLHVQTLEGATLRKRRDLLVESGGARVRFSRKEGLLFLDRDHEVNSPNCLRFEARRDLGTLDAFAADAEERPRLFSAQFLHPVRHVRGGGYAELVLRGRLGRTADGFGCEVRLIGCEQETFVRLGIRIDNRHEGCRLRARFLGVPLPLLHHECTDVHERIESDAGGFIAFTLVRACGRLLADGMEIPVPGAQCLGTIQHWFRLGRVRS